MAVEAHLLAEARWDGSYVANINVTGVNSSGTRQSRINPEQNRNNGRHQSIYVHTRNGIKCKCVEE